MSILVEQQDETIDTIQETAVNIEKDTEAGTGHTNKAVGSARAARKKRWICFGLFVLLLIIVAIIIAVVVLNNKKSERFSIMSCAMPKLTDYRRINTKRSRWSRHRAPTFLLIHALYKVVRNPYFTLQPRTILGDVIFASAFPSEIFHLVFLCSSVDLGFVRHMCTFFTSFSPRYASTRSSKAIGFTPR